MSAPPRRFDHTGLQIIDDDECLKLLSSVPVGRLVYTRGGLPAVRLVNFHTNHRTVLFATADGDKYRAAQRGDVVAFEADTVDPDRHRGWTVTATGRLSVVDPAEAALVEHTTPIRPWAANHDQHLIRLTIEVLEGRRLLAWAQRPHPSEGER
ncbi:pyridoxamine 5'-phosphate oxidase family protein [Kribbella monticola]|uniref:pyridoxamine 5'-phosphate oxidase family protein n=1 Tax=Kribbella monticola TaxID=2185285 RepID=UPI000DD4759F|nr:pyridoxamine 5'-phosphate oxidase family protein [Kribbella monticola]